MNALLLTLAVAAADPQGSPLENTDVLVDRDWVAVYAEDAPDRTGRTVRQQSRLVLSLRSGESWESGKAWIFRFPQSGPPQAWKGFYTVYNDQDDEDNVVVSLRMTRKYTGRVTPTGVEWDLENRWKPIGVYADLPVTERTIPDSLSLTARSAFYVDAKGEPTRRYHEPDGLVDALVNGRQENVPSRADFLSKGTTFQFTDRGAADLLKRLTTKPPSYTPRAQNP